MHEVTVSWRRDRSALTRLLVRLHGLGVDVVEVHAWETGARIRVRGDVGAERLQAVASRLVDVQRAGVEAPTPTRVVMQRQPSSRRCTPHPWATRPLPR